MKLTRLVPAFLITLAAALPSHGQEPTARFLELVERPVVDAGGAKVADMYDVVVDTTEARVAYLVVTVGMRVVPVRIPTDISLKGDKVVLVLTRARLESLPALDMAALGPNYKRGKDVVGGDLKDEKGADIGDVKDFVIGADGTIANVVVAFDPKTIDKPGWIALPRSSVRPEGRDFVATFNLDLMRPASETAAEVRRIEAAKAAAIAVDRDERLSQLIGRKFVDPQGKPVADITDIVADGAGTRILYVAVNMAGGGPSGIAMPTPGLTRNGDSYVVPSGAAAFAPPPSSAGGKRLSELSRKALVDGRGKQVGIVRDIVVNLGTGKVHYAVAEFEPAWIAAGYLVTIKVPREDGKVELNALMGTMLLDQKAWPDINHPQFIANIDAYLAKQ